ncbi:hypothetical protein, partial [Bacillus paranthracis]|uniref:hypothetical protein n=1 Tax=Bacillus paranthracis TaxID=2026186 RepID=UPI001E3A4B02
MDAFRTAVYRYAVYLAVLFIGGPLLLLLFVYGADIFVSYMSYGLDKLHLGVASGLCGFTTLRQKTL